MAEDMDLSGIVEKIQEMFSTEEGKSQIQDIASMIGTNTDESGSVNNISSFDNIEMIMKINSIMSAMNSAEATRQVNFLKSLGPLLKPSRQSKVDNAVKFLSMGRAIEAFKNM